MIERTEALALRILPVSETSRMATWLSPDGGLLVTLMKGACRPKSPFLGQAEVADTSELLYYARDRNGVHIARECARLTRRSDVWPSWREYVAAEYVCWWLLKTGVAGRCHDGVYRLAQDALDHASRHRAGIEFAWQWELRLLKALGLAPQLDACLRCARPREPFAERRSVVWRFSSSSGGILCETCAGREGDSVPADLAVVSPDALVLLRQWLHARSAASASRARCLPAQRATVNRLLSAFLACHAETDPVQRRRTLASLASEPAALTERI